MAEPTDGAAASQRRIDAAVRSGGQSVSLAGLGLDTPPRALTTVPLLRELDLSGNRLARLPDWFGSLTTLRVLDLSGNRLTELPGWISALTELETLLLRGNALVTLPDALLGLSSLTRLDLGENQLVEIPEGMARLTALAHLDLAGNRHLISPPPAIVAQGSDAVLAYLRSSAAPLDASQPAGSGKARGFGFGRRSVTISSEAASGAAGSSALPERSASPNGSAPGSGPAVESPRLSDASSVGSPRSVALPPAPAPPDDPDDDTATNLVPGLAHRPARPRPRKGLRTSPVALPANRVLAAGGAAVLLVTAATLLVTGAGSAKPHPNAAAGNSSNSGTDTVFTETTPTDGTPVAETPTDGTPASTGSSAAPPNSAQTTPSPAPPTTQHSSPAAPTTSNAPQAVDHVRGQVAASPQPDPRTATVTVTTTMTPPQPPPPAVPPTTQSSPPPPGPTVVHLSGQISCISGLSVEGVWVQAAQGSGFAPWKGLGNGSTSDYWFDLPVAESYHLNVGCGGTTSAWAVTAKTAQETTAPVSFNCQDIGGQPNFGTCARR